MLEQSPEMRLSELIDQVGVERTLRLVEVAAARKIRDDCEVRVSLHISHISKSEGTEDASGSDAPGITG